MRIAMITFGSEGDVRPLVALGQGLVRAGHRVVLLADAAFDSLCAQAGIDHVALAGGSLRELTNEPEFLQLMRQGLDARVLMRTVFGHVARHTDPWSAQLRQAAAGADAVVAAGPAFYIGLCVAEALRLPAVGVALQPISPTREFPPIFVQRRLPALLNRPLHWALLYAGWLLSARPVQRLRRQLGLRRWPLLGPTRQLLREELPLLLPVSTAVVQRPADWPPQLHQTGYWFLDAAPSYAPPSALREFLAAGPPPVYIGFGSMAGFDAEATAQMVKAALAGRRAVVAAGWGGLRSAAMPATMLPIDAAPHDWLLPRMALAVHHGGAGTTAAAARAGIPQVIMPHLGDQPFWAARMAALGTAPPALDRHHITADTLAGALRAADTPAMHAAAARLGARLRQEDGVAEAIRVIEALRR